MQKRMASFLERGQPRSTRSPPRILAQLVSNLLSSSGRTGVRTLMNRSGTITRSSLVFAGIVVGVVSAWACGSVGSGSGGGGGSALVPDAHAAGETPCKTWKVKSFAFDDSAPVTEFELPDGYEPLTGSADPFDFHLNTVLGKKCVAY